MVDKITFMETLHSVQEIAKASPVPMTKEEIKGYFQDMELSEEQQEMIYQFLLAPQEGAAQKTDREEKRTGIKGEGRSRGGGKPRTGKKPAKESQNLHFQMYLREIAAVPVLTREQQNTLYQRLLAGEESVTEEISHQWLGKVIRIARGVRDAAGIFGRFGTGGEYQPSDWVGAAFREIR